MGNAAIFCTYIDPCNTLCDKRQVLFNHSEWDDPIVIDNSQNINITEQNKSKKIINKRKPKDNIY